MVPGAEICVGANDTRRQAYAKRGWNSILRDWIRPRTLRTAAASFQMLLRPRRPPRCFPRRLQPDCTRNYGTRPSRSLRRCDVPFGGPCSPRSSWRSSCSGTGPRRRPLRRRLPKHDPRKRPRTRRHLLLLHWKKNTKKGKRMMSCRPRGHRPPQQQSSRRRGRNRRVLPRRHDGCR